MLSKLNNKISKQKSTMFLYALKGALSMGIPLTQAVKMLSKTQPKPLNNVLKRITFLVENKNDRIEDLLEKFGIINYNEKLLLEKANDTKFAVNEIIKMRKIQNQFTGTLIKLFRFPLIVLITMPFLAQYLVGVFSVPLNQLKLILKSMGITYHLTVPNYFFYVYHPEWLPYVAVGSGILFIGMFIVYMYLSKNKYLYSSVNRVSYIP
jgi:type II secretory pathway component PulF